MLLARNKSLVVTLAMNLNIAIVRRSDLFLARTMNGLAVPVTAAVDFTPVGSTGRAIWDAVFKSDAD